MINKSKIIETLISQHREIVKDIKEILSAVRTDHVNFNQVKNLLEDFKIDLSMHLELENNIFYKTLLDEFIASGQDITNTKEFVDQMHGIGDKVLNFLTEFSKVTTISENFSKFRTEFLLIVDILTLRMETEESGIYTYWM